MRKRPQSGGGWAAIAYTLKKARMSGGFVRMGRALLSRNACKTCALGMGGQDGGMVNEGGRFPEVCKKSVQAMAADMQGRIRDGFFDSFSFDELGRFTPRDLEGAGRLVAPLYAGPDDRTYREVSWETATDLIVGRLRAAAADETFFYFSGRSSNEAGFLLQLLARLYGTNNVNNCSYFCHQASGVGLSSVTGSGTATVMLDDVDHSDLLFLIGGNPASNHPRLMRTILDLRRRGGKVVVINPLRELGLVNFRVPSDVRSLLFGSRMSDAYLMPHIGGDIAVLLGISKAVIARGALAHEFIARHTDDWALCQERIEQTSWSDIEARGGVARADLEHVADLYCASERTIFAWTMGITHHAHGVDNVRMIANLAMLRGMLGREGRGLLPLRGHSNVQGMGSMGVVPELKGAIASAIEKRLGVPLPKTPGLDTLGCVQKASQGHIKVAMHLGGNLFGSCPDAAGAREALRRIGLTTFLSTTLNTGHIHGRGVESLILPVRARDEESQATTQESMFNFVRMSDGGPARHAGPRSEVEVIAELGRRILGESHPADFTSLARHDRIREFIGAVVPGYRPIGGMGRIRREFHVEGRILHDGDFQTSSGRARFHAIGIPGGSDLPPSHIRLMTIRSEGQFNTVVYEDEDLYRGQERRDIILMNRADMDERRLNEDDRVDVISDIGRMADILVREADIRAGNAAMYYPEANVLVPRAIDAESRTPSFKNVAVRILKRHTLSQVSSAR